MSIPDLVYGQLSPDTVYSCYGLYIRTTFLLCHFFFLRRPCEMNNNNNILQIWYLAYISTTYIESFTFSLLTEYSTRS